MCDFSLTDATTHKCAKHLAFLGLMLRGGRKQKNELEKNLKWRFPHRAVFKFASKDPMWEKLMNTIEKLMEEVGLIVGEDGTVYINFVLNNVVYNLPIKDEFAQTFLREKSRELADDDSYEFKTEYIQPYIDKAVLYGKKEAIYHRMCHDDKGIEYSLWDRKHRIIQIDNSGALSVIDESENTFVKRSYMKEQPLPKKCEETLEELLAPFINLDDDDFVIFMCLLVSMFIVDISHYAVLISSDYGCGKTTLTNIVSELVDNSINGATVMPSKLEDIKVNMAAHYLVSFDNTVEKNIKEVSDLIAASITGASYCKRKLYSDLAEINVKLHNVCIINGIDILNQNKDLLSRSLVLQPLKLTEENRMTDKEFWDSFHAVKPKILFRLFKTVGKVLSLKGTIDIASKERMADAYEYVVLAGIALGYEQEDIENLILENRKKINTLAYQNEDGIVAMVAAYVAGVKGNSITGSVTSIYKDICRRFNPEDYGVERFPQSASAFSRKLSELQADLLQAGVCFVKSTKKNFTELTLSNQKSKSKRTVKMKNDKIYSRPSNFALPISERYQYDEQEEPDFDEDKYDDEEDEIIYDYPDEGDEDESEEYEDYYEE